MSYNAEIRLKAVALRKNGLLFTQIAAELGITKSTAFAWTKSIQLSAKEQQLVTQTLLGSRHRRVSDLARINQKRRSLRDKVITEKAIAIVKQAKLSKTQQAVMCSVMFWCEGGKNISGGIQFINSDPVMISAFLALLRNSFELDEGKFRALIHLHSYHQPAKQLDFWSKVTLLPKAQFHKPYIKPNTGKNKRVGYPGCVSVRYLDRNLGKLLQMIYTEFGSKYRGVR